MFPGALDLNLERDYMVYGRRSGDSELAVQNSIMYGTSIKFEEI